MGKYTVTEISCHTAYGLELLRACESYRFQPKKIIKQAARKQKYEEIKKQWDEGLLVLDGVCKVVISNDTDVIAVEFKEEEDD